MGFQSSFNQALGTIAGAALGAKHIQGQKQANEAEAYRTASALTDEKSNLAVEGVRLDQENKMLETKNAEAKVGFGLAKSKYTNYLKDNPSMSAGKKAYASRLNKEMLNAKSSYEEYSNKLESNLAQKIALKERIELLKGKEESAPKRVKEILGKVGKK